MAIKAKGNTWVTLLLLGLAVIVYVIQELPRDEASANAGTSSEHGHIADSGKYEKISGCRWVEHRQNDGDSFHLKLPDGRVEQFRLYFVDAPESAFRTYGGGENNHKRIHDQAVDFGLTDQAVVEVGLEAKKQVEALLQGRDVTIYTIWEDPFGDQRYHAFIAHPDGGWLHEWLTEEGLVRVHTKGAELPDGTKMKTQLQKLETMERKARQKR